MYRMGVFVYPVLPDTAHNQTKDMTGQIMHANPWKNQEPGIVGHEVDIVPACVSIPSDKGIARGGFPCSGTKEQTGQIPTISVTDEELKVFSHGSVKTEVMIMAQIISHTTIFIRVGRWNMNRQWSEVAQCLLDRSYLFSNESIGKGRTMSTTFSGTNRR